MSKSKKFAVVKKFYDLTLWLIGRVKLAVRKGWITEEEFKEITGEDFHSNKEEDHN